VVEGWVEPDLWGGHGVVLRESHPHTQPGIGIRRFSRTTETNLPVEQVTVVKKAHLVVTAFLFLKLLEFLIQLIFTFEIRFTDFWFSIFYIILYLNLK
jgi:hypothetical protein